MKIQFQETIKIEYKDARYERLEETMHLTLKDAHLLLKQLSETLSEIPY